MLHVEQNVLLALSVSDYAYVLSEGRVTLHGEANRVASNPIVQQACLGIELQQAYISNRNRDTG